MGIVTVRFSIGAGFMLLWGLVGPARSEVLRVFVTKSMFKYTIPSAVLGPFLATLLWFVGYKYTLAGKAAIYNQLSTIFTLVLAAVFLKEPLTKRKLLAVVLAFTGALMVALS